jgi:hypothetical protein
MLKKDKIYKFTIGKATFKNISKITKKIYEKSKEIR